MVLAIVLAVVLAIVVAIVQRHSPHEPSARYATSGNIFRRVSSS